MAGWNGPNVIARPETSSKSRIAAVTRASAAGQPVRTRRTGVSDVCMIRPSIRSEISVCQNASPKSAAPTKGILGSRSERGIHPVARTALSHPVKLDSLDIEYLSDKSIQVDSPRNRIPTQGADGFIVNVEAPAEIFVNLPGKESYLPLVVVLVVKEPVPEQAAAGDTLDRADFDDWRLARRLTMVPEEVVCGRNIEPHNLERLSRLCRLGHNNFPIDCFYHLAGSTKSI